MQNTAIAAAKDSSLQKELLSEAHVSVREDEREALAFGFVMELRSIAGSDKRHSSTPLKCICNPPRGSCSIYYRVEGAPMPRGDSAMRGASAEPSAEYAERQPTAWS